VDVNAVLKEELCWSGAVAERQSGLGVCMSYHTNFDLNWVHLSGLPTEIIGL